MFTLLCSVFALMIAETILRGRRTDHYDRVVTGCSYRDVISITNEDALCIEVYEHKLVRRNRKNKVKNTQYLYLASLKHVHNGELISDITEWYPETIPRRLVSKLILLDIACIHIQRHANQQSVQSWKRSTRPPPS